MTYTVRLENRQDESVKFVQVPAGSSDDAKVSAEDKLNYRKPYYIKVWKAISTDPM